MIPRTAIAIALAAMLAVLVGALLVSGAVDISAAPNQPSTVSADPTVPPPRSKVDDDDKYALAQCDDDDVKDYITDLLFLQYSWPGGFHSIDVVSADIVRNGAGFSCEASILDWGGTEVVYYIEYTLDDNGGVSSSALYPIREREERKQESTASAQPTYVACYGGKVSKRRLLVDFDGDKAGTVGEDVRTWSTKALRHHAEAIGDIEERFRLHLIYAHGYGDLITDDNYYDSKRIYDLVRCFLSVSPAKLSPARLSSKVRSLADPEVFWKPRPPFRTEDQIGTSHTEPCEHDHWLRETK